jgi:hypothetical protein
MRVVTRPGSQRYRQQVQLLSCSSFPSQLKMPKETKKNAKHECSGCQKMYTALHGLTTHRNSCLKLQKSHSSTSDQKALDKEKKTRRLLERLLSRNSQPSAENIQDNVLNII